MQESVEGVVVDDQVHQRLRRGGSIVAGGVDADPVERVDTSLGIAAWHRGRRRVIAVDRPVLLPIGGELGISVAGEHLRDHRAVSESAVGADHDLVADHVSRGHRPS